MKASETTPGQHIKWLVRTGSEFRTEQGYVIGIHKESWLIRVSAVPGTDVAHWIITPATPVEVIE